MSGALAGLAYDQWKDFMLHLHKLKNRPLQMPFLSSRTALVLSVVAYARALDLSALKNAKSALEILKKHFGIDADTLRYVGKILHTEAPQSADMPAQLHQLKEACRLQPGLSASIVLCLLELAVEEGKGIDAVSTRAIREAGHILGVFEDEWRGLSARFSFEQQDDDPYTVIGVSRYTGGDALVQAYHARIRETHPDSRVMESNSFARARLVERAARINAAYEKLKKSRA